MTTIKDTIREAGRLEQIMDIIIKISGRATASFPIRMQYDYKGNPVSRVTGNSVLKGIELYYKLIDTTGEEITDDEARKLWYFQVAVESDLEMRLHNYANSVSHRQTPSEEDMEEIRDYQVLNSSLDCMIARYHDDITGEYIGFSVPEGWKKIESVTDKLVSIAKF